MCVRGFVLAILACAGLCACCPAQEILQVTAKEIQQHADHRGFPVYPPIAKAARVQGSVVFDLQIGTTGKIESMKVVSGPPMLQQAAIDCLKQWTFHPFEKDGSPVVAKGQYTLIFVLGDNGGSASKPAERSQVPSRGDQATPSQTITVNVKSETAIAGVDAQTEQQFNEADNACKDGILGKVFNDATVASCRKAAELADRLPAENNFVAKRSAFVYAATAYGDVGRFQDALPWATKAVEIVKLGHDGESGTNAAYATRAEVEVLLGDFTSADRDLSRAEDSIRQLVVQDRKAGAQSQNPYLLRTLVQNLTTHATVLQHLDRPDEAKKKLDEADSLK